jgi:hypothetical protein
MAVHLPPFQNYSYLILVALVVVWICMKENDSHHRIGFLSWKNACIFPVGIWLSFVRKLIAISNYLCCLAHVGGERCCDQLF